MLSRKSIYFFLSAESKKKNELLWNFFNKNTQPFLSLNLPQNKFHKKLRKIIINFHPKISWHHPKITYENNVREDMKRFINTQKNKKLPLNPQVQPWQILINDDLMIIFCLSYSITTVTENSWIYFKIPIFFKPNGQPQFQAKYLWSSKIYFFLFWLQVWKLYINKLFIRSNTQFWN